MIKNLSALALAGAVLFVGGTNTLAYEVKAGDTLSEVAEAHDMSVMELASMNPEITDLNFILIGQNLNTNKNDNVVTNVVTKPSVKVEVKVSTNSNTEVDLLARLVRAEAQNEPYAGKVAVAKVVLNRVESSQFPNSISEVIYQKGQFQPVTNGSINKPADAESNRAVHEALSSGSSNGALFFYNPRTATNRWLDSKTTVSVIGNHTFKR